VETKRYSNVAVGLHWLIALAIITLLTLGLVMTSLGNDEISLKFKLYQLHKSIGITVLSLSLLRLLWRLAHRPPPAPPNQPAWERRAAKFLHIAFYCFMLGMPLTGWAIVSTSAFNIPTVLYGVIPWPDLPYLGTLHNKAAANDVFENIHSYAAYVLIGAVVLHVAAALKHHFLNRDLVLWRMLPARFLRRHLQ
jgi:cytochrome b561